MTRWVHHTLAAGLVALTASAAVAQQVQVQAPRPTQPNRNQQQQQNQNVRTENQPVGIAGRQSRQRSADEILASILVIENNGEVKLAQLAKEKARKDDVKQFAQHLIDDHTKFIQKLQKFAAREVMNQSTAGNTTEQRRQVETAQQTPGVRDQSNSQVAQARGNREVRKPVVNQSGAGLDLVALKQELGEKCVQTLTKQLQQQDGHHFDAAYMTRQVAAHLRMLDTLEVFRNHATSELQSVIDEGIETTRKHLKHAQDVLAKVSDIPKKNVEISPEGKQR